MQIEETSLWQSFLDGNRESFQAIYTRYYDTLYEYGMRRVDNADQVKDTIQDLFVKLWTNRRNLGVTDNIKYYLLLSLKRRLMDSSVAATVRSFEPVEIAERFRMEFTVDSEYLRREQHGEQAKKLLVALDQLTPRQKEVIYLRFFEELSYEEIAGMLDISVKGAYKLSYRALDALKELLKISKKDLLLLLVMVKMYG